MLVEALPEGAATLSKNALESTTSSRVMYSSGVGPIFLTCTPERLYCTKGHIEYQGLESHSGPRTEREHPLFASHAKGWMPSPERAQAAARCAALVVVVEAGGHGFDNAAVGVVVFEGPHERAAETAGGAEVDVSHFQPDGDGIVVSPEGLG